MRTIEWLLKYKLTKEQKIKLEIVGICNWCWGKWWFSFDSLFKKLEKISKNAERVKKYVKPTKKLILITSKLPSLKSDIKKLCMYSHDIDFELWGNIFHFIYANFDFITKIVSLIHWCPKYIKFIVFCVLSFGLHLFWWKYFRWGKRKTLSDILKY